MLFAFANPPMQTPDETDHYLRTYAISMGRFDFDAQRGYPEDVDELVAGLYRITTTRKIWNWLSPTAITNG